MPKIENEALRSVLDSKKPTKQAKRDSYRIALTLGEKNDMQFHLERLSRHYGLSISATIRMLILQESRRLFE
jgi:hypothetical protein